MSGCGCATRSTAWSRCCADLQAALIDRADEYAATIMPGFTHLQTAQPITFGHHLMAYVEMFGRDRSRLADCRARLNESPLGAAALAGSPHPIDPRKTAKALGFDRPMANSLDAVSDRDYVVEFIAAASLTAVHLSRLSEEIVIWCSRTVPLHRPVGRLHHRQLDHAAEAQSRRRRADARQGRPHRRRLRGALHHPEGPAAHLRQGHAGGQGAAVRRRQFAGARHRGDGRHGARPQGQSRAHARRRLGRLFGGDRSRRLAGAQGRPAVPPGPSRHRPAGRHRRRQGRRSRQAHAWPRCRRSSPRSIAASIAC